MGYASSTVKTASDFTQGTNNVVFVQTLAGGINPWNTKMMVSGTVATIFTQTTADGRSVKVAQISNPVVTIPLGDGKSVTQNYGTGVIKKC